MDIKEMNSFQDAFYSIKKINKDEELMLCSFWYQIEDSEIFPLCKLWVLYKGNLFYSDSEIYSNSCNSSLILNNFFMRLKATFQGKSSEFDFNFQVEDEENTANLELRLIINPQKDSYVSVFRVTLIRSFKANSVQEFMQKISEVCLIKDRIIEEQQKEIAMFSNISDRIRSTQEEVKVMREETGVKLAAKFMVLMNQIKEKSIYQMETEKSSTENQIATTKKKFIN